MDRVVSLLEHVVKHGSRGDLQHGTKAEETRQAKSMSSIVLYRRPDMIIRTDFGDGVPPVGGEEKSREVSQETVRKCHWRIDLVQSFRSSRTMPPLTCTSTCDNNLYFIPNKEEWL